MAIILKIVQRFRTGKRTEFMELEKQFAALEQRGILLKGERMTPLASREPGNTLIWAIISLAHMYNCPCRDRANAVLGSIL
jgi:hypothetical protein